MGLFHTHQWQITGAHRVVLMPEYGGPNATPVGHETNVAMVCELCGDVKTKKLKGLFNLDQLNQP